MFIFYASVSVCTKQAELRAITRLSDFVLFIFGGSFSGLPNSRLFFFGSSSGDTNRRILTEYIDGWFGGLRILSGFLLFILDFLPSSASWLVWLVWWRSGGTWFVVIW
ncbi:hypothetical protein BD289DRAFT_286869 [Coniella lustricola]|uniref:Uncharacterized protein n=1 Tax=Coniella lustricola TaxID=2025994 RepID=A0A2T3A5T3_9PEZI|nr:hypothetical protein BD289DRAFT_286869 [Coniella lustricola]